MLVCFYELVEGAQRLMPSVVRLNTLDYADGCCWNSTDSFQMLRGAICFGETRMVRGDGERDSSLLAVGQGLRGPSETHGEFPRDVVKAAVQIGDEIPDYAREGRRRLGCDDAFDTYDIPLKFGDDIIGVCAYVPPGVFIERFQVLP